MSISKFRLRRGAAGLGAALLLATGVGALAAPAGAVVNPIEPSCPASVGNARFVRYIYLQILMRCPDPGGLTYWTGQLDGGLTRSSFTDTIDMSTENVVVNNVDQLYNILGRAPSASERADGINMIRSTKGDATLIAKLVSSDEYFGHVTGADDAAKNAAFINDIYPNILDRPADAGALGYFDLIMGRPSTASTRHTVAMSLEHSAENAISWTTEAMGGAFHRAPDGAGVSYWSNWLLTSGNWQTFRMWTLMLASPEGYALAQTQPNLAG